MEWLVWWFKLQSVFLVSDFPVKACLFYGQWARSLRWTLSITRRKLIKVIGPTFCDYQNLWWQKHFPLSLIGTNPNKDMSTNKNSISHNMILVNVCKKFCATKILPLKFHICFKSNYIFTFSSSHSIQLHPNLSPK